MNLFGHMQFYFRKRVRVGECLFYKVQRSKGAATKDSLQSASRRHPEHFLNPDKWFNKAV